MRYAFREVHISEFAPVWVDDFADLLPSIGSVGRIIVAVHAEESKDGYTVLAGSRRICAMNELWKCHCERVTTGQVITSDISWQIPTIVWLELSDAERAALTINRPCKTCKRNP